MPKDDQQGSAQDAPDVNTQPNPQQDGTPDQPDAPDEAKGNGNKEAAKYRVKLREAEQARDALAETVSGLQRQLVAGNMPPGSRMNADALWTAGRKPGDFYNEDGTLDTEKLATAVKEVHVELGVRWGADPIRESGGSGRGLQEERATLAGEVRRNKRK